MQRSAIMRCIFISERRITWYLLFYAYFAEITVKLTVLLTLQRIYRLCFLDTAKRLEVESGLVDMDEYAAWLKK